MASRADISAGKAFVELYAKSSSLTHGLADARRRLHDFGVAATLIGAAIAAAGTTIIAPITAAVTQFAAMGSELNDMSKRTGVAASALAEFKFAAEQSGAQLSDVEIAIRNVQRRLVDAAGGSKSATESLAAVGLTAQQLKGKLPDQQFQLVAERLAAIADPAKRTAAAVDLLGKSGTQLLPMVAELAALRAEARRLGLVPTDQAVKDAATIGNLFGKIKSVALATVFEIGSAVGPILVPVLETVKEVAASFALWVRVNGDVVRSVAKITVGIIALGGTITGLGTALVFASKGLGILQLGLALFTPFLTPVRAAHLALLGLRSVTSAVGEVAARTFRGLTAVIGQAAIQASGMVGRLAVSGRQMVASIASSGIAAGRSLFNGIYSQITRLATLAPSAFNRISAAARAALAAASAAGSSFSQEMAYWLSRPFQYFKAAAPLFAADFVLAWQNAGVRVRQIATIAADGMRAAWSSATAAVSAAVGQVTSYIAARWSAVANPVTARIIAAWSMMSTAVSTRVGQAWNAIAERAGQVTSRLKAFLAPVLPLIQQDFMRIVSYARTAFTLLTGVARVAAGGVVAAWRFAGPAIANGLVTAVTGAFSRIRATGVATAGLLARGIGGAGRGLGGLLSGGAGLLSMFGAGAGGMLGSLAGIVPQLLLIGSSLTMLLNPATFLIGAIAGGVFIWAKYSASGRAAMASLASALSPFVAIAKQTFGGVADAIKAGDLALAGQVAMAGLKLAFVKGMVALADSIGGTWGAAVKDIGGKLAGGDFAGAWTTAVKGMAAVWDAWSEGVVKTFTSAISSVVSAWKEGVGQITDFLLKASAEGGALGQIASGILGVDMQEESQRKGVNWELQKRNLERGLAGQRLDLADAEARGDKEAAEKARRGIANSEAELARNGFKNPAMDVLGEAQKAARDQVAGTASAIDEKLREIDRDSEDRNQASNDALAASLPKDDKTSQAVADAEAELARLTALAAQQRAKVDADKKQQEANQFDADKVAGGLIESKNVAGTFSAAALVALGQGGGADQVAKEQLREMKELKAIFFNSKDLLADVVKNTAKTTARAGG